MPSPELAKWPESWPAAVELRHHVDIIGIIVLLVLAPVALAAYSFSIDRPVQAFSSAVFAVLCTPIAWTTYHTRFRRRRSGTKHLRSHASRHGSKGLLVPYSTEVFIGYAVTCVMVSAAFATGAVYFYETDSREGSIISLIVFGLVALFSASLSILIVIGKFVRGWLLLSPEGIYQRGWTFSSYLTWKSVELIYPPDSDGPCIVVMASADAPWERKQITKLWRQDKLPEIQRDDGQGVQGAIIVPGKFLAADPAVVLHLLVYYANHPNARSELGTEAALRRARTGDFG